VAAEEASGGPAAWEPTLPPRPRTEAGALRRVGVELELTGPGVDAAAAVLVGTLGGTVEPVSRYELLVHGDAAGPWRVELDFGYLKRKGREQAESGDPPSGVSGLSEAVVRAGAEAIVPVEVVSPPLPIPRLAQVEELVRALRGAGALGTRAGLTYAFGVQLNVEVPARDVDTLLGYLRAFLCLHDWLVRECRIDLTRRLTGYSASFPYRYVRRVVDAAYRPDRDRLIDDYLEANPTRNRALDLLPLWCELDAERVRRVVQDDRVEARPALHYRLPNSEIDDPGWGLHVPWDRWLQVEHLAADPERLAGACAAYAAFLDRPVEGLLGSWAEGVEPWLVRRGDR